MDISDAPNILGTVDEVALKQDRHPALLLGLFFFILKVLLLTGGSHELHI